MTVRTWVASLAALVLMTGAWMAGAASASRTHLRSKHSEPAWVTPLDRVAITDLGKLYHNPSCPLIHGPVRLETGSQAIFAGYTPCTRCLPAD